MKTRTFKLNKLVRDGVFDSMVELGQDPKYKNLKGDALIDALKQKIIEEAKEVEPKSPKAGRELADILEMVEQLAIKLGIEFDELRKMQKSRRKEVGAFNKGIFITDLAVPTDDKWAEYYAAEPSRFPEIKK